MKLNRFAGALATIAILSGCGLTGYGATAAPAHSAASPHTRVARLAPAANPALAWLDSVGGQAQVTLNQDVDVLVGPLIIENQSATVANHLIFEADARAVRAQARTILADPALLPGAGRAAYVTMLNDLITVASLLQPGAGYGSTAQDYTAWYTALRASNITVS
jgi:hypothetical protein